MSKWTIFCIVLPWSFRLTVKIYYYLGLGYSQLKDKLPESIEIACHNGPESCTLSGPTDDMENYVKDLQSRGVFAKLVNVSNIAYHSRYIKPAAPLLLKYLKEVLGGPVARSSKWISTSNQVSRITITMYYSELLQMIYAWMFFCWPCITLYNIS